jgi:peptide/nickel transport system substrate-binding protein
MVSDGRTLWLADPDAGIVARVDPERGEVARIRLDGSPGELARAGNSIWVAGALSQTVSRVDLVTESVTQTIRVSDASITALAAGAGSVWAADGSSDRLLAIDPRSGNIRRAIDVGLHPTALAVGAGAIWIADYAAHSVAELDPGSGQTLATVAVGNGPTSIAVGDDGVWTANALDSTVSRIDPASDAVVATIPVDSTPVALQPVAGGIWVASEYKATLSEIDPSTNRVVRRRALAGRPYVFAADGSRLWLDVRPPPAPRGGRLVLLQRPAISIDPGRAALWSPFQSTGLVHDGLVTFNHAGGPAGLQLVPDLAVALPTPTDAGKTYTFRLRPGIPYSDGRPVRAADFRRGVERSFTMRSLDRDLFDGIVGARACLVRRSTPCDLHRGVVTDERARTVTFHLTHPDAQFLSKLTNGGFAMPVPAGTPMHPTGNTPIPGTGPYEVESADRHHIRYVRNPHFREWSHAAQPAAQADEIVWRFGLSPQAEAREVARGRADWVADPIPARLHPLLRIRYAARLHSYPSPDTEFLQFNMRRAPFDDVRARRAVNLALDRRLIAQIVGGRDIAQPACQLLPPGLRGYTRYCPYRHSLAAARRLVAASGTRGMRVTVWGSRDDPYAPRALTRDVASALRRIGYRTRINEVTQAYLAQAPARVFAHMQIGPPTGWSDFTAYNFFEPWMSCNGAFNHRWHCDPRLDGAIERARSLEAREPRAAAALAARIDRKLVDEAVVAPYVNLQQTDFVSSRVTDLQHHAYLGLLVSQVRVR